VKNSIHINFGPDFFLFQERKGILGGMNKEEEGRRQRHISLVANISILVLRLSPLCEICQENAIFKSFLGHRMKI